MKVLKLIFVLIGIYFVSCDAIFLKKYVGRVPNINIAISDGSNEKPKEESSSESRVAYFNTRDGYKRDRDIIIVDTVSRSGAAIPEPVYEEYFSGTGQSPISDTIIISSDESSPTTNTSVNLLILLIRFIVRLIRNSRRMGMGMGMGMGQ